MNNKKGFTLAELLIVVAIIAVLTSIAIPVFSTQLEKAREATDAANMRSAYAECVSYALSENKAYCKAVDLVSDTSEWKTVGMKIGDITLGEAKTKSEKKATHAYICVAVDGKASIVYTDTKPEGYTEVPAVNS